MADINWVNAGEMEARADKFSGHIDKWEQIRTDLENTVKTLLGQWEGDAKVAFEARWQIDVGKFEQLHQYMLEFVTAMKMAAANYKEVEGTVKGVVESR